jgi:hypothetical protein
MTKHWALLSAVLAFFVLALQPVNAQVPVDVSIGTAGGNFTVGSKLTVTGFNNEDGPSGLNQPAPFNAFCGSDTVANDSCSASWTFTYMVPAGDDITSATLSLGIYDIDSAATGNQIASFTLDGTDDLTSLLNASSEGLNSGAGAPNNQYNILMITIPTADLAALDGGSATFALALQGPGLGRIWRNATSSSRAPELDARSYWTPSDWSQVQLEEVLSRGRVRLTGTPKADFQT